MPRFCVRIQYNQMDQSPKRKRRDDTKISESYIGGGRWQYLGEREVYAEILFPEGPGCITSAVGKIKETAKNTIPPLRPGRSR